MTKHIFFTNIMSIMVIIAAPAIATPAVGQKDPNLCKKPIKAMLAKPPSKPTKY